MEESRADAALTALCRECLSLELQQRPRDAGRVAQRVAEYHAEVEARLRKAELDRNEAEVKTREERKRRRLAMVLSSAVLLVFVAGALISTLFALDAGRQADEARKLAVHAENQKTRADNNAETAVQEKHSAVLAREEAEQTLIEGLLRPISSSDRRIDVLSSAEREVFTTLARLPSDRIRMRFLEEGLRTKEKALRLDQRADWVIQATVGLNASRRRQAEELLLRRLRDREAPLEVREACVTLGIALDIQETEFGECVGEIILSKVIRFAQRNNRQDVSNLWSLLEIGKERWDTAATTKAADAFLAAISKRNAGDKNYLDLDYSSQGLTSVIERLDASVAAIYVRKAAELLLIPLSESDRLYTLGDLPNALAHVSEHLDAVTASKAADQLVNAMSKTTAPPVLSELASGLASVSERLDAAAAVTCARKAAFLLVTAIRKTNDGYNRQDLALLSGSLASVSMYLDAPTAATYSASAAELLVTTMSRTREPSELGGPLASLSERLDPVSAAKFADRLIDAMSKVTDPLVLSELASGLASVSERLDIAVAASYARKALELLVVAINKPTRPEILQELAGSLGHVSKRVEAAVAAKAADRILTTLSKTTKPDVVTELASSLAILSERLDAAAAATNARKAAELLVDAMRKTAEPNSLSNLATGLASLSERLEAATASKAAVLLLDAMRKTTEPSDLVELVGGLSSLCKCLDPAAAATYAAKVADLLVAAVTKNIAADSGFGLGRSLLLVSGYRDTVSSVHLFKNPSCTDHLFYDTPEVNGGRSGSYYSNFFDDSVTRWCTPDILDLLQHPLAAGSNQRSLLAILEQRTHRHFRNTWHFLNWARSNGVDFAIAN